MKNTPIKSTSALTRTPSTNCDIKGELTPDQELMLDSNFRIGPDKAAQMRQKAAQLRLNHPNWSATKLMKKVAEYFNVNLVDESGNRI